MAQLNASRFCNFIVRFRLDSHRTVFDSQHGEAAAFSLGTSRGDVNPVHASFGWCPHFDFANSFGVRSDERDLCHRTSRHTHRVRTRQARKIAHPQSIEMPGSALVANVTNLDHVIASRRERVMQSGIAAKPGLVVAVGQLAAFRIEQPNQRVQCRAQSSSDDFNRQFLSGGHFDSIVVA